MALDHLVIMVSDLKRSLPWYDVLLPALGLTKTWPHVWVDERGVAVDLRPAGMPEHGYERYGPGLNHLGISMDSRAAVDAVAATMAKAGFDIPQAQEIDGAYAIFFKDDDGMRVEAVFEPPTA